MFNHIEGPSIAISELKIEDRPLRYYDQGMGVAADIGGGTSIFEATKDTAQPLIEAAKPVVAKISQVASVVLARSDQVEEYDFSLSSNSSGNIYENGMQKIDLDFDSLPPPLPREVDGKPRLQSDITGMPYEEHGTVRMVANAILPMSPSEPGSPRKIWRSIIRNQNPTLRLISEEADVPVDEITSLLKDVKDVVRCNNLPITNETEITDITTVDIPLVRSYISKALEGGIVKFGYSEEDLSYVNEKLLLLNLLDDSVPSPEILTAAD